jgi:hypothetical protein
LVDLKQAAHVASEDSSAGDKCEVSFWVASVGFGNKVPIGFVEFGRLRSFSGEELLEVLNFFFVDIFVVKPVCRAGRQLALPFDLVIDLLFFFTVVGF